MFEVSGSLQESLSNHFHSHFEWEKPLWQRLGKRLAMQFGRGCTGKYLQVPQTAKEWARIGSGFEMDWNFPNCLGALDGNTSAWSVPRMVGLPITIIRISTALCYWQRVMPSTVSL